MASMTVKLRQNHGNWKAGEACFAFIVCLLIWEVSDCWGVQNKKELRKRIRQWTTTNKNTTQSTVLAINWKCQNCCLCLVFSFVPWRVCFLSYYYDKRLNQHWQPHHHNTVKTQKRHRSPVRRWNFLFRHDTQMQSFWRHSEQWWESSKTKEVETDTSGVFTSHPHPTKLLCSSSQHTFPS